MTEAFPDNWHSKICAWAAPNDRIHEIHLFGSRAKGDHLPESDVDLAYLLLGENPGEILAYWIFETEAWEAELSALLGARVELHFADPDTDSIVWPAVLDHGQLIYRQAGCLPVAR